MGAPDELDGIAAEGEFIAAGEGEGAPGADRQPEGPLPGTAEFHAVLEALTAWWCPQWRDPHLMPEVSVITPQKTMLLAEASTSLINEYFPKLLAAADSPGLVFLGALMIVFVPAAVSGVPRKPPEEEKPDDATRGDS